MRHEDTNLSVTIILIDFIPAPLHLSHSHSNFSPTIPSFSLSLISSLHRFSSGSLSLPLLCHLSLVPISPSHYCFSHSRITTFTIFIFSILLNFLLSSIFSFLLFSHPSIFFCISCSNSVFYLHLVFLSHLFFLHLTPTLSFLHNLLLFLLSFTFSWISSSFIFLPLTQFLLCSRSLF